MKTDKELLGLAAKAAGIPVLAPSKDGEDFLKGYDSEWNPLTDDGDALRLASSLNLIVDTAYGRAIEAARLMHGHNDWNYGDINFENDDLASTRRAIVRAAAAIGERL